MGRATLVLGIALVVVGAVWILQGIDVLKGSFMTGQAFWGWMGAICVMAGLPLTLRGWQGRRGGSR